jgi:hypothetical protein
MPPSPPSRRACSLPASRWRGRSAARPPRALATVLAHELTHVQQGLQGLFKPRDCTLLEAWALAFQSDVWWILTDGQMPAGTALEADLTRIAGVARRGGVTGLHEALAANPALGQYCAAPEV